MNNFENLIKASLEGNEYSQYIDKASEEFLCELTDNLINESKTIESIALKKNNDDADIIRVNMKDRESLKNKKGYPIEGMLDNNVLKNKIKKLINAAASYVDNRKNIYSMLARVYRSFLKEGAEPILAAIKTDENGDIIKDNAETEALRKLADSHENKDSDKSNFYEENGNINFDIIYYLNSGEIRDAWNTLMKTSSNKNSIVTKRGITGEGELGIACACKDLTLGFKEKNDTGTIPDLAMAICTDEDSFDWELSTPRKFIEVKNCGTLCKDIHNIINSKNNLNHKGAIINLNKATTMNDARIEIRKYLENNNCLLAICKTDNHFEVLNIFSNSVLEEIQTDIDNKQIGILRNQSFYQDRCLILSYDGINWRIYAAEIPINN